MNNDSQQRQRRMELKDYPELMVPAEVIEFTRLGRGTVYEALRDGRIPSIRVGRNIRVSRAALAAWVDGNQKAPQDADIVFGREK